MIKQLTGRNLCKKSADPDGDEDDVSAETVEDVSLSVDLTRVDFVEKRHHDERVEDDCEVLIGRRAERGIQPITTIVHVEQPLSYDDDNNNKISKH